jgi:hypothetical protein
MNCEKSISLMIQISVVYLQINRKGGNCCDEGGKRSFQVELNFHMDGVTNGIKNKLDVK